MRDILDAVLLALMLLAGGLVVGLARLGTRVDEVLFEEEGMCCR